MTALEIGLPVATEDRGRVERRSVTVEGVVQGVGFRPFVHRLATELGVDGFVGNSASSVFVEVQGRGDALDEFVARLRTDAPPLAHVDRITAVAARAVATEKGFRIVPSRAADGARTLVSPDVAMCADCLHELFNPRDRRFRHPFITCTNCGPRFSIIKSLPYDRPATTMAGFALCARCDKEYHNPADRRYHAQPLSCPQCGPQLTFLRGEQRVTGSDDAIAAVHQALADGLVVAVKGIGGFHLATLADDPAAVRLLRARKARAGKAFAVMARDLNVARRLAEIDEHEAAIMSCAARPIVLLRRRLDAPVAPEVAPGNPLIGVMLPYTPLHYLLFEKVPGGSGPVPEFIVLTSANLSDEPICFEESEVDGRLPLLADAVLTHDRPIHVPCDDSVVRVVDGRELPIRRSRGYAPLPTPLPGQGEPVLAVGGELKNTFCLTAGEHAFCSAHVGDMGNAKTLEAFERATAHLNDLYGVEPKRLAADLHPAYLTRGWAEREAGARPLHLVQHHHAHVVSLLAEHGRLGEPIVGVAFDGTGYGTDGSIWGGEVLVLGRDSHRFTRAGHLRPVALVGGDVAVRNPFRMALAYLRQAGIDWEADLPPVAAADPAELRLLKSQLGSGFGCTDCTSAGRLFDAVSSLLGIRHRISYEGQAAIELEVAALDAERPRVPLWIGVEPNGILDPLPLIHGLVVGLRSGTPVPVLAAGFHEALAVAVAEIVRRTGEVHGIRLAGLTGGVFQNVLLLQSCRRYLQAEGFEVLTHRIVPPNDGGLALGQAAIAVLAARAEED